MLILLDQYAAANNNNYKAITHINYRDDSDETEEEVQHTPDQPQKVCHHSTICVTVVIIIILWDYIQL